MHWAHRVQAGSEALSFSAGTDQHNSTPTLPQHVCTFFLFRSCASGPLQEAMPDTGLAASQQDET